MNKKLIESLAKLAKVQDLDAFTEALKSESDTDFKLDTDNLVVRTKDEDSEFKSNIITEAKPEIWKQATEIQIKNMKKDLGLEFEGKEPEDFISNFKSKVLEEAKIEPNKKIEELNASLESLRGQLSEKDNAFSEFKNSTEKEKIKFKASSLMPEPKNGLSREEAITLYFSQHEIKEDGVYRNGEKLKDNLEKAISFEDSVLSFADEKGWAKEIPTGRGGGAQGQFDNTSLPTNTEEYESYIKSKGWNVGSQEANAVLNEMAKAKTE